MLIANKMESNGVAGNLMVSEATKKLLETDKDLPYIFKFHKTVEISNFNTEINSFLVYEQSSIREISNEHIEIDNIINNK